MLQLIEDSINQNKSEKTIDLDVSHQDLEVLESRIEEIEKYLGIQDMDLDYFIKE